MSEQSYHSSIYNVTMGMILKVLQVLFPLISAPYVSRVLQPEGMGRVSFVQSVINIFLLLTMLGIPLYGIKACAKVRDNREELSRTVKELLIINTISLIVTLILLTISLLIIPKFKAESELFIVFSFILILNLVGVEWFYQAIEQYDYLTLIHLFSKLIALAILFIFVKTKQDVLMYAVTLVISSVGLNFISIIRLNRYVDLSIKHLNFQKHLKYIITLFAFSAFTTVYTSMDTIMLGFLSNQIEVGYYNLAVKIKNLLVSLITVVGSVLLPRATVILKNKGNLEFKKLVQKTLSFNIIISLPISIFFITISDIVIEILGGSTFYPTITTLKIIMPAIVFIAISNVIGIQYMIPLNKEILVLYSTIGGAISNIILNLILIPQFGATGAALATTISEFIVMTIQIISIRKDKLQILKIKELIKIILSLVFATIIIFLLPSINNIFTKLIIDTVLYFTIYFISLIILRESLLYDFLIIFKSHKPKDKEIK